ncbi:hypothetical protein BBJ28_00018830, partial [Nothophytophthora sp. Chile5]
MKPVVSRPRTRTPFVPLNVHFQSAAQAARQPTQAPPDAIDLTVDSSPPQSEKRRQKQKRRSPAFYEDDDDFESEVENPEPSTALDLIHQMSPLLSLIQDQVIALIQNRGCGIPAAFLTSQTVLTLKRSITAELRRPIPSVKLLYLTPEKIGKSAEMME